jgi:DIE2/ALG10 family
MIFQPFVYDHQLKHMTLSFSGKEQKKIWVLSYIMSVVLVLVPAPLIEFRYFTIPLVLLIIHSPIMSERNLLLLSFVYAVINNNGALLVSAILLGT